MLTGTFRGAALGCGTDVWRLSEEARAGTMPESAFLQSESAMIRSAGHCNTMGTASTMACMAEALGMTIPGTSGIPAPDSRLKKAGHDAGRHVVEMVRNDLRPSQVMTRGSFLNAIVTLAAIGGSTNAVVHLLALAGRLGIDLTLDDFDVTGSEVPLLVDLQPAGRHLMEDFHRAGGLLAVLNQVRDRLDSDAITITGKPLVDELGGAEIWDTDVIRPRDQPLQPHAASSCCAEPLPHGRRHQTGRGHARTAEPPRACRRVRQHRGRPRSHRRSGPRRRRELGAHPPGLWPQGLPGYARSGEPPAPPKAAATRRA
jgi:dihydroxy-acid dehydratase